MEASTGAHSNFSEPSPDDRFLSRSEAARYLGVAPTTIYKWARTGGLPCIVTLGGHTRFRPADLDAAKAPLLRPPGRRTSQDDQSNPSGPSPDGLDSSGPP